MVVPPKHAKMIIFSRKTHGCWVPPFRNPPNLKGSQLRVLEFSSSASFLQVPGRVRIRQILLRAWRGGTAPKPEDLLVKVQRMLKKSVLNFGNHGAIHWAIRTSSSVLCFFFFFRMVPLECPNFAKQDPVRRKQIQRMHEVHYGKSGSYRWFVKPWTAFQEAEGKLLQVWSQIRMATLVPTSIYV